MDLRQLCYFVAIADCGSLMRASKRLNIAQPALSVHINNLEVEVGNKLLDRSNRGVELTSEGRHLYQRAKTLLNLYQETISSIRDSKKRPHGGVSVGIPSSLSKGLSVSLYRRLRDELPDVSVYLTDAGSTVLREWLVDGRVDFAILFSLPEDATFDAVPLGMERFCLVGRPEEGVPQGAIPFSEIFDIPLVLSSSSTTERKILDDVAERHGRKFLLPIETESFPVTWEIIRSGEAKGLLPLSSVYREACRGEVSARLLVDPEIQGTLSLTHLASSEMTPAKRAVREIVAQVGREHMEAAGAGLPEGNVTPILRGGTGATAAGRRVIGL
jgi:LysR family nitrogen assimilation transcriptional regulator